ncbi:MAG: 1-acyl-sn-glycerol-3-phosphate acyltransferase [Chitinophagales bacterium]|nr:1-acyl-sn-glycerol-3-phosphate acyltransferase [Chitinophagales bacterium]
MLYAALKIIGQPAIRIFCKRVDIDDPSFLREKGPLLLAANHPNSFLDAIILDLYFEMPIYSLARGDAFYSPSVTRILTALKILPVYRTSEGVENLSDNYKTFDSCLDLFRKNGVVLMFSEGKCINEWHLRPLKKGTARLAIKAWEEGIPLKVLPVALNYDSFDKLGKTVIIRFGKMIHKEDIPFDQPDGQRNNAFNQLLRAELEKGVFEIDKQDEEKREALFETKSPVWKKIVLAVPALLGWLTHAPLYLPLRTWARKKYLRSDHYDSVMMGLLLLAYPVYLILFTLVVSLLLPIGVGALGCFLLLPLLAWCYVQV